MADVHRGTLSYFIEGGEFTKSGWFADSESDVANIFHFKQVSEHAIKWDKTPPEWLDKMVRQHLDIRAIDAG